MTRDAAPALKARPRLFGLGGRFNAVFLTILLIASFNIISLRDIFREADGVAETINIAGKLRMLSQKMAFELAVAAAMARHWMSKYSVQPWILMATRRCSASCSMSRRGAHSRVNWNTSPITMR